MNAALRKSPLFAHITDADIDSCLECSRSETVVYEKDEPIFLQQSRPQKLFILLDGSVAVCRDSMSGKRAIVTTIGEPGELFGEVFLFLDKSEYDNYAVAVTRATVLQMPKSFLKHTCVRACGYHSVLIANMLTILAEKAYYLSRKLQIVSSPTLRQKITKVLLQSMAADGTVMLSMNREALADFLNVARPSLSRELMSMQVDGLLTISGRKIKILNLAALQEDI